jgi:hypothetical protein
MPMHTHASSRTKWSVKVLAESNCKITRRRRIIWVRRQLRLSGLGGQRRQRIVDKLAYGLVDGHFLQQVVVTVPAARAEDVMCVCEKCCKVEVQAAPKEIDNFCSTHM